MDIQYVHFNDSIEINGAQEIPDLAPRSLEIVGRDFLHAIEVYINEVKSPSFVIASKNRIIAQVPSSEGNSTIRNITVLSSEFTATFRSRLKLIIGENNQSVTGLRAMMQTFLKLLFTSTGSDAFVPRIGGSALRNIGKNYNIGQSSSIVADFSIAVRRTAEQIRALQSQQPKLPDDEKLLSANVLNSHYEAALSALVARVELISQSGVRAIANLEL